MAKIIMTVRCEIIDARGERFVLEREIITPTQDNTRFWSRTVEEDLEAVVGTIEGQVANYYGRPYPQEPDPRERPRP